MDLIEKNIISIGGSSGIGLPTARLAFAKGAAVTLTGASTTSAQQAAQTIGAARVLAPVRFNAVLPGHTDTPMWRAVLADNRESVLAGVAQTLPVKRIARADEIAEAVLFLMQNESVTGEIIHVDGGARLV